MTFKLGVSFDGFGPYDEAIAFAKLAVGAGASSLWMADHLGYREAIISCLGLAAAAPTATVIDLDDINEYFGPSRRVTADQRAAALLARQRHYAERDTP